MKKLFVAFVLATQLLAPITVFASYNSAAAQNYLTNHANNPWSTMALAALGDSSAPSQYLKLVSGNSAIEYTAPILAITAIGQDPRTFGEKDYIQELKKYHNNGQIGDVSTVNDDIFGLLALIASGEPLTDSLVIDAKNFIYNNQQSNGGWGFATAGGSDSNMTAAAISSLVASGVSSSDSKIQKAFDYLRTAQNNDGGFTYDPTSPYGTGSDSSSTAWVLWAINAAKLNTQDWLKSGHSPVEYLESNQAEAGYFKYQNDSSEDTFSATTTAYAVIALTGKTLPLNKISTTPKFEFRIEGKDETVCAGQAEGPTALDVIKNASSQCGYTYNIKSTSFGQYLEQINNDKAEGLIGWLYRVNYISPAIGASEYTLKNGDSVLWHYGDFNWKPTRLSLSNTQIANGESGMVTMEYFNESNWLPLAEAKILFGASENTTNSDGQTAITGSEGYYKVYGEKQGYIRSNSILLKIGNPSGNELALKVNVIKGDVQGSTISFIVDTSSIDFGSLKPGEQSTKSLSIKNTGNVNINLESIVKGDEIFTGNLYLDDAPWQNFNKHITASQSQTINAKLSVPINYLAAEGNKTGTITFWASTQ